MRWRVQYADPTRKRRTPPAKSKFVTFPTKPKYGFAYRGASHILNTDSKRGKEENMTIYTTKQDYIAQVITPALGEYAAEHDIDAIADAMLVWHDEINDKGQINLGKSGFMEDDSKDFWAVVEAHAA